MTDGDAALLEELRDMWMTYDPPPPGLVATMIAAVAAADLDASGRCSPSSATRDRRARRPGARPRHARMLYFTAAEGWSLDAEIDDGQVRGQLLDFEGDMGSVEVVVETSTGRAGPPRSTRWGSSPSQAEPTGSVRFTVRDAARSRPVAGSSSETPALPRPQGQGRAGAAPGAARSSGRSRDLRAASTASRASGAVAARLARSRGRSGRHDRRGERRAAPARHAGAEHPDVALVRRLVALERAVGEGVDEVAAQRVDVGGDAVVGEAPRPGRPGRASRRRRPSRTRRARRAPARSRCRRRRRARSRGP